MATVQKVLYRGAAPTTETVLYQVPANTSTIVTSIVVANTSINKRTFSLKLDVYPLATNVTIMPNDILTFDIKQVVDATDAIFGFASSPYVQFHISGVEIS